MAKQETQWNLQYAKLLDYKQKNGDCIVPRGYSKHDNKSRLGSWVNKQRNNHQHNTIRQDRKDLLDDIGFVWNVEDHEWNLQYAKLVAFQRQHDHCLVPIRYQQDESLGIWVRTQRAFHTSHRMRQARKDLLSELGFVWRARSFFARENVRGIVVIG